MTNLKRDLSDLPDAATEDAATAPDIEPLTYSSEIMEGIMDKIRGSSRPHAVEGRRFRASWSGGCWRQLAYKLAGVDETNPSDDAGYFRMNTGTLIHEMVESFIPLWIVPEDREVLAEQPVDLEPIGIDGSATGDLLIVETDQTVCIEIKTINGFGFKMLDTEGPRYGHVTQGALSAEAQYADELIIWYISMENISKAQAAKKGLSDHQTFMREFHFYPNDSHGHEKNWKPYVEAEQFRVKRILAHLDAELTPDAVPALLHDKDRGKFIPVGARINNPNNGTWVVTDENDTILETGRTWMCGYCNYRDRCITYVAT